MSNAQTEARDIETAAWNCEGWPDWLRKIVEDTNEAADRLDMSAEQAHAYAVLSALAAKNAELVELDEKGLHFFRAEAAARERAERAEAQLAEARKALEPFANIEPSTAVAHDGSEAEPYCVYLACRDRFDFTGADLAAARRVREGGKVDG